MILTVLAGRRPADPDPAANLTLNRYADLPLRRWTRSSSTRLSSTRQGNPVTDLTVDDFEILEDGRPQPITSFGGHRHSHRARRGAHGIARHHPGRAIEPAAGGTHLPHCHRRDLSEPGRTASRSPATVRRASISGRTTPRPSSTSAAAARRTDRISPAIECCCSARLTG